jgi:hypothetical protein
MIEKLKHSRLLNSTLLIGGFLSLKFLFSTLQNPFLAALSFALSVAILFLLYRTTVLYRDHECSGTINYGKAFYFLFRVYILGSVISSIIVFVYAGFINKDYLDFMMNEVLKSYEKLSVKIDDNTYNMIQLFFKPASFAFLSIFSSIFTSAFWALIIAAFVKKDKNIFEA